jgi:hypothetical protein
MSEPVAEPAATEPLVPLTTTDLAQLFANNRASVIDEVTKHAYSIIIDFAGKGLTNFEIHHPLLHTTWMNDSQFVTDMLASIQAYFPGSSITFIVDDGKGSVPHLRFSYSP